MEKSGKFIDGTRQDYKERGEPLCGQTGGTLIPLHIYAYLFVETRVSPPDLTEQKVRIFQKNVILMFISQFYAKN